MAEENPSQPGGEPAASPPAAQEPPTAPVGGAAESPDAPSTMGPQATPKPRRTGKIIAIVAVAIALVAVLGVIGVFMLRGASSPIVAAKVDDCFAGDDIAAKPTNPTLRIVDCSDGEARYKVVGKLDGKSYADAQDASTHCQPFIERGAKNSFWQEERRQAGKGPLFCLAPAK